MKKSLAAIVSLALLAAGTWSVYDKERDAGSPSGTEKRPRGERDAERLQADAVREAVQDPPEPPIFPSGDEEKSPDVRTEPPATAPVVQEVPFTSQAPSAQWEDPVFQNACEEASMLMAAAWLKGSGLPGRQAVESEIRALSDLASKKFGEGSYDTSAEDTATLFREYFRIGKVSVRHGVALDDLKRTVASGALALVPVDGRKLGNPNFTPPGPDHHMLAVIGYDPEKKEFVTNDPGTRKGAGYRYAEGVLFGAMRDYPTGDHRPIIGPHDKAALIVER
jgi:hypothetical protein